MASSPLPADAAQIRALIEARVAAIHAKDIAALVAAHAPEPVMFDVLPPLAYQGLDTVKQRAEKWAGSYDGPIGYEIRDVRVTAGADAAFAHYLYHVTGTLNAGATVAMWVRATLGLLKVDGAWKIAHDHESVPFDPATGQASLDLTPDTPAS
ncbi:MAG TPA: SgcJ/EcaC family oxidoreductase [Herpetosiphonaceae bacterium]|nr:SgcJ/EcaC family oxidoreductase [Herpetosiphonaceae bacterium]